MSARYTLQQLRYFVATVEQGGIAQASRKLNISQPSISAAIKNIEESFGIQLFMRHHAAGLSLMPAGQRFYGHAVDLLRHAREFEQNAMAESDAIRGQIQLGCFETVTPTYMPRLLAGFLQRYPQVDVRLRNGFQDQLLEGMSSGAYDIVMMYDRGLTSEFERVPLLSDLMPHALLPRDHRLADRRSVSLHELVEEPMILLDVKPSGEYFRSMFTALGLTPNVRYSLPSVEMVRGLVGQRLGYSVLVTRPVSDLTYDGHEVVTVPLSDPVEPSRLVIAWHGRSRLTNSAAAFLHYCQEAIGRLAIRERAMPELLRADDRQHEAQRHANVNLGECAPAEVFSAKQSGEADNAAAAPEDPPP